MAGESPTDIAGEMRRFATVFVETSARHGFDLDYSPESLTRVEELIDKLFADLRPWRRGKPAKRFANMAPVVGAYVGEVFVRQLGGQWARNEEFGEGVLLPSGMWTFPTAKAAKRFANGHEDGLDFYFGVIRDLQEQG
jgi:hypothetical protein